MHWVVYVAFAARRRPIQSVITATIGAGVKLDLTASMIKCA